MVRHATLTVPFAGGAALASPMPTLLTARPRDCADLAPSIAKRFWPGDLENDSFG